MGFREKFQRFMQGRYGSDNLSKCLLITSIVFLVLSMLIGLNIFYLLAIALLVYCYFRMFSKNTYKRYDENQKFLSLKSRFLGFFKGKSGQAAQMKDYRFFKCPNCRQKVRVPKGKGKIKIHCPKCQTDFIKKS